jgi:hypothetical protein
MSASHSGVKEMRLVLQRTGWLAAALLTVCTARADDLADFNRAVDAAAAHNRTAIGYFRNGNVDLAAVEVDRLRETWSKVSSLPRPSVFDRADYTIAMTDIATRLVTADMMLNLGHPDNARQALLGVRDDLYQLRKSAHVPVLADCIRDANETMDKLMTFDGHVQSNGVTEAATGYGASLAQCDRMANEKTRSEPEFRRLVDGAKTSLARVPEAVASKDEDLLHRLLIELRSFDNLLAFRFG